MSKGIKSVHQLEPGQLYTTNGKDVWVLESFCEHPTATLRNLNTDEKRGGAVGCMSLQDFVRLVPEYATEVTQDEP